MNSMTGFGKAELKTKAGTFTVEISSVNNRFLEISPRLPRQFFTIEPNIRDLINSNVSRGKINLYVGFEEPIDLSSRGQLNIKAAVNYYKQLKQLKKELGLIDDITIHDLVSLPEVTRPENGGVDDQVIWPGLKKVIMMALNELLNMRKKEGLALAKDMKMRVTLLEKNINKIEKLSASALNKYREKINNRINELLTSPPIDPKRLEEEIAVMAERTDISEECIRFVSHLEQFQNSLKMDKPVGKTLNFILQELNREANTIGSKCSEINISQETIIIKSEIEKLREQVQNIE